MRLSPFSIPARLQMTTLVSRWSSIDPAFGSSHSGRNLCAQKFIVDKARVSPISSGDSNQAFRRIRRFDFSATQWEAISYGPSTDLHSAGFRTFMSMQIPTLTEFSGGGRRKVANPVPTSPRNQGHTIECERKVVLDLPGLAHVVSVSYRFDFRYLPTHPPSGPNKIAEFAPTLVMLFSHSSIPGSISSSARRSGYPATT